MKSRKVVSRFTNACRTCMGIPASHLIFNSTEEEKYSMSGILEMMIAVSRTDVTQNDGLPDKICESCLNSLEKAFRFQKMCLDSYVKMRNILNCLKIRNIQENSDDDVVMEAEIKSEKTDTSVFSDLESAVEDYEVNYMSPKLNIEDHAEHIISDDKIIDEFNNDKSNYGKANIQTEICNTSKVIEKITSKFKCDFCEKEFDQRCEHKRHIKVHNNLRDKKFECTICRKYYISLGHLNRHQITHHEIKQVDHSVERLTPIYKCVICNKTFHKQQSMASHMKSHYNDKFTCPICQREYKKLFALNLHRQSHENTDQSEKKPVVHYKCESCEKVFDNKDKYRSHLRVHNANGKWYQYECTICKRYYKTEGQYDRHRVLYHSDTSVKLGNEGVIFTTVYKCEKCDKDFDKQQALASHMRCHSDKKFICCVCEEQFAMLHLLKQHVQTHQAKNNLICNLCKKQFSSATEVIDHIKQHDSLKQFKCNVCNKAFQNPGVLKVHQRLHTGERQFLCSKCGKSFSTSTTFKDHIMRHSDLRPYQCEECGLKYGVKGDLKKHISAIHLKIKRHSCDTCGMSFAQSHGLLAHKRIHTGEKPFPCEMCDMRFYTNQYLKRHRRTHTGERPYACKFCHRKYPQKNELNTHLRTHLGDKIYQCSDCTETFKFKNELKDHMAEHFKKSQQTT